MKSEVLNLYASAWRQAFTLRSLVTMGLDALLVVGLLLTALLYKLLSGLITKPLLPIMQAVQAGVPPPHTLVTGALAKLLLTLLLTLLLATLLYSLAKRYSYDLLERHSWSWRRWLDDFLVTLALLSMLFLLPLVLLSLSPTVAAYAFVALLLLVVVLLPLLYVRSLSWWRRLLNDPLPLLALWLLPITLLALLFLARSFSLLSFTFTLLCAAALALALLFAPRWTLRVLLALAMLFFTWMLATQLLLALSLLSPWLALSLSILWLFLFFAFGRNLLITIVGELS